MGQLLPHQKIRQIGDPGAIDGEVTQRGRRGRAKAASHFDRLQFVFARECVLSAASLANVPSLGAYSASKAAAFSITQALRGDLAKRRISVHGVFAGPIDTDMVRAMDMQKTSPELVAKAILDGVEQGLEDISPDPFSEGVLAAWRRDPKGLERQFASTMG